MGFLIPLATAAGSMLSSAGAALGAGSVAGAGAITSASIASAIGTGTASASTAAAGAITAGQIATGLAVAGGLYGGVSAFKASQYQAKVLENNAKTQDTNRSNALIAGNERESRIRMQVARTIASQRAAYAANGVDVDVGSPVDIANSSRLEGEADVAVAHYQALQEAYGFSQEAWSDRANAKLAKAEGRNKLIGSFLDAGSSYLSGASSLRKKQNAFGMAGIGSAHEFAH